VSGLHKGYFGYNYDNLKKAVEKTQNQVKRFPTYVDVFNQVIVKALSPICQSPGSIAT
jgi:hypothetical protein